jgi:hypothetical protein
MSKKATKLNLKRIYHEGLYKKENLLIVYIYIYNIIVLFENKVKIERYLIK